MSGTPTAGPAPGIVVVDKPPGLTSHDVVGRCRRLFGTRRVGHAGTLDPMATGVLVVGVARATKILGLLTGTDKTYLATMRLGESTDTDDADGHVTARVDARAVSDAHIEAAVAALRGHIAQVPSTVSAIKVGGRRAYALAREGEEVTLAARPVHIGRFVVTAVRRGQGRGGTIDVDVEVDCSSGTYIRALARDVGAALGVGGHLTRLRRTRIGPFTAADAVTLDALADAPAPTHTLDAACLLVFGRRDLDEAAALDVSHGRALPPAGIEGTYAAVAPDGSVIGLLTDGSTRTRSVVVLRPATL